jgi:hypothetical protein
MLGGLRNKYEHFGEEKDPALSSGVVRTFGPPCKANDGTSSTLEICGHFFYDCHKRSLFQIKLYLNFLLALANTLDFTRIVDGVHVGCYA